MQSKNKGKFWEAGRGNEAEREAEKRGRDKEEERQGGKRGGERKEGEKERKRLRETFQSFQSLLE